MRVAISGSRTFPDRHLVERVIERRLWAGDFIVIGDAPAGVDLFAWEYLKRQGIHRAHWQREIARWKEFGIPAGHERNGRMLRDADELIAIYAPGPLTRGTTDAVEQALAKGIPVHVYHEGQWQKSDPVVRLRRGTSDRSSVTDDAPPPSQRKPLPPGEEIE